MQPTPTATPTQPAQRNEIMWPNAPIQPTEPVAPIQQTPLSQPSPSTSTYYVGASSGPDTGGAATYRVSQIIYLILGIGEALMIGRVALKLLAANADVGFVRFIYGVSAPLVAPFQGIFPTPTGNGSVVEFSSVVAIAVYALAAWALARVVLILGRQPEPPTAH